MTMTADERLALVRLKLERADKHIDDIKAALRAFFNSNPYKVGTKRDPDTRKLIYYIENAEPVPVCTPCQFEFGKKAARVGGGRLSDAGLTLAEGATDSQG